MSRDGDDAGWEDLFAPLNEDGSEAGSPETGSPETGSPEEPPVEAAQAAAPAPEAAAAAPAEPTDPFAAMRARQDAAQSAAREAAQARAAAADEPPLTRRELRERERAAAAAAGGTAAAWAATDEAPALVEPPVAAQMTGPILAAAWQRPAEPTEPAPQAPTVPDAAPAETPQAETSATTSAAATDTGGWSLSGEEDPDLAEDAAGEQLPTVPAPIPAVRSAPAGEPQWFAAAEAVSTEAVAAESAPIESIAVEDVPTQAFPVAEAVAAERAEASSTVAAVRTAATSSSLEDWRPRPVPGGGFPIPLVPGAGGGGGGGGIGSGGATPPRRRRSLRWLAILLPILLVLGGAVAAGAWVWTNHEDKVREILGWSADNDFAGAGNGEEIVVTIRSGDIGSDIAVTLHQKGVTKSFDAFYDLLLKTDPEPVFEAGNYRLQGEMSAAAALAALQDPESRLTSQLMLPEGTVLWDALAIMSSTTGIPLADFEEAAANPQAFGLPAEAPSLEGYLFPATYDLDGSETASGLIQRLVDETISRLDAAGVAPEDRFRVLTLASVVQREMGPIEGDAAKIARVFLNRLDQGMNLESDATVAYGTGNLHTVQTSQEERDDASNPYNTYANPGLPIGPVGAVGEVAIDAVLHPADGPWLFFVTIDLDTGETMFSETIEEHEQWVDVLWNQWCEASDENAARCS